MHEKRSKSKGEVMKDECGVIEDLPDILEALTHYHVVHTNDSISRFTNDITPSEDDDLQEVAIYVTTNPAWIVKFAELTKEEFPGGFTEPVSIKSFN